MHVSWRGEGGRVGGRGGGGQGAEVALGISSWVSCQQDQS